MLCFFRGIPAEGKRRHIRDLTYALFGASDYNAVFVRQKNVITVEKKAYNRKLYSTVPSNRYTEYRHFRVTGSGNILKTWMQKLLTRVVINREREQFFQG